MKLTNFFVLSTNADLEIAATTDEDLNTLSFVTSEKDGGRDFIISFLIVDRALSKIDYKRLLDRFLVSKMNNNDIYWAYKQISENTTTAISQSDDSHPSIKETDVLLIKIDINIQKEILNLSRCCWYRGYSLGPIQVWPLCNNSNPP